MRHVVCLILGGGKGTRLLPLTEYRSKPAVPLGGKYRLIDVPISNCINSDINRMYVLTQFNSVSLHRHIRQTYNFDLFHNGFVEILAAQQTLDGSNWYQGTADAVRKQVRFLKEYGIKYVLILSGDQLYRMNFKEMLATHVNANADVTISTVPVHADAARGFGILQLDGTGKVTGFVEKPKDDASLAKVRTPAEWIDKMGIESNGREYLASMGIYLWNRDLLVDLLESTDHEDFGKDIFPLAIKNHHVQTHLFDGYWEDIGTIEAFYEANLALTQQPQPPFSFYDEKAPIYTRGRYLPPSKILDCSITESMIGEGCILKDCRIYHSVLGIRSRIESGCTIEDSLLMGSDFYESAVERESNFNQSSVPIGIGAGTTIRRAIIDKNARIGKNVMIINKENVQEANREDDGFYIRSGIVVVIKNRTIPDGMVI